MKITTFLFFIFSLIIFSGCDRVQESKIMNSDGITKISDNLYVKGIDIYKGGSTDTLYFLSDKNGNILNNIQPVGIDQNKGKYSKTIGFVDTSTTINSPSQNYQFTFKCNRLEECRQKINIVESSLN